MFMVNVGKYSINESYGVETSTYPPGKPVRISGPLMLRLSSLVADFFRDFGVSFQGSD